jgi:hypothetical protein
LACASTVTTQRRTGSISLTRPSRDANSVFRLIKELQIGNWHPAATVVRSGFKPNGKARRQLTLLLVYLGYSRRDGHLVPASAGGSIGQGATAFLHRFCKVRRRHFSPPESVTLVDSENG